MNWQIHEETLHYYVDDNKKSKIAAFDMDHTLIKPKSGAKFPTDRYDWKWLYDNVPEILKKYNNDGFKIVIFSNQGGVDKGKQNVKDLYGKIEDMSTELGFNINAFLACGDDIFRKPYTTMWDFFVKLNGDIKESFYIGDAAGRLRKPKDFSCGDRAFAYNCNLKFQTPEEFFENKKPDDKWEWKGIDPNEYLTSEKLDINKYMDDNQEMIILVGRQASGKSTFAKNIHNSNMNYVHINRDTLKTKAKCEKETKNALVNGNSVIIDNTNPSIADRKIYIDMANEYNVPVKCIVVNTDEKLCHHLNYYREIMTNGNTKKIPQIAYNIFKKNYVEPNINEGFESVQHITFVPNFENELHKKIFLCKFE